MASYSSLEHREGKQDWEIKSDESGNGNSGGGFVAGRSTSVMSSLAGVSRYKAVVSGSEGYDQVSYRRPALKSSLDSHPTGGHACEKSESKT